MNSENGLEFQSERGLLLTSMKALKKIRQKTPLEQKSNQNL